MKLDNGEQTYGSYCGVFVTILFGLVLFGFSYAKMETLVGRDDIDIISAYQDSHFLDNEEFSAAENDFFFAAALTTYSSDTEPHEKKEYGELLIEHYGWGNEHLGYKYGSHALENHNCTDEELGLISSKDSVIYPVYDNSLEEVKTYKKKFKCIDKEDLRIWGNYNSKMAMQLSVKFHMCKGYNYCKSEQEIRDWLSGKFIVVLYNQMRFKTDEFGSESVIKEARIQYIPISS